MVETIEYDVISDSQKLIVGDIVSKIEAIDELLSLIQTERATSESKFKIRENLLRAEKMNLTQEMRKIRKARLIWHG